MPDSAITVMVVDDDYLVVQALKRELKQIGATVAPFTSSQEAFFYIVNNPAPDVLVSDFLMPNLNGVELVRMVKSRKPHIPCILLTAYPDAETVAAGKYEKLFSDIVPKPWGQEVLAQTIKNAVSWSKLHDEMDRHPSSLPLTLTHHCPGP